LDKTNLFGFYFSPALCCRPVDFRKKRLPRERGERKRQTALTNIFLTRHLFFAPLDLNPSGQEASFHTSNECIPGPCPQG